MDERGWVGERECEQREQRERDREHEHVLLLLHTVTMLKWLGKVFVGNSLLMYSALTPLAAAWVVNHLTTPTRGTSQLTERIDEWSEVSFQIATPKSIERYQQDRRIGTV